MTKEKIEEYKMHINEAIKEINSKNVSLDRAEEFLNMAYFDNGRKFNYDLLKIYGKINFMRGDLKTAKDFYIASMQEKKGLPTTAYYGLFEIALIEEDYKEAKKNLLLYDSCFDKNLNVAFYCKCLDKLLGLGEKTTKENYMETKGYINRVKAPKEILVLYKKAEEYFDNEQYDLAIEYIIKAQQLCTHMSNNIDFTYLLKMLDKICVIDKDNKLKKQKESLNGKDLLILNINDPKNVGDLIKLINILIDEKNYKEAHFWINHRMDKKETEKNITELNLLRKRVNELYSYENNKDEIDNYVKEAEKLVKEKKYKKAFDLYRQGFEKLESPLFLFKIAELNYSIGNIEVAKKYFIKYMDFGIVYENEYRIYMGYINMIKDNNLILGEKYRDCSDINYSEIEKKAEEGYFNAIKNEKSKAFTEFYNEALRSIRNGDIYFLEREKINNIKPSEIAFLKVKAAIILFNKGIYDLADKYYEESLEYTYDKGIYKLLKKYKKLKK